MEKQKPIRKLAASFPNDEMFDAAIRAGQQMGWVLLSLDRKERTVSFDVPTDRDALTVVAALTERVKD